MDALTAMKQALEALEAEGFRLYGKHGKEVAALRAAIKNMEMAPVAVIHDIGWLRVSHGKLSATTYYRMVPIDGPIQGECINEIRYIE